jgi:hypothetical protein
LVLTATLVVATLWLLGAIDWLATVVGLEQPLPRSPIGVSN